MLVKSALPTPTISIDKGRSDALTKAFMVSWRSVTTPSYEKIMDIWLIILEDLISMSCECKNFLHRQSIIIIRWLKYLTLIKTILKVTYIHMIDCDFLTM
jgi:hypothetical protein